MWFPVRRALILRAELGLPHEERLDIDPGLLSAILRVPRYTHGSRSMSKIIAPLKAALPGPLQPCHLPPPGQLGLQIDLDEFRRLSENVGTWQEYTPKELEDSMVNIMAPEIHETYNRLGIRNGWMKPEEAKPLTEYLKIEENKFKGLSNYPAARRIPSILALAGLRLEKGKTNPEEEQAVRQHIEYHLDLLANAEHMGWMQWYFDNGWTYHAVRNDKQMRHNCLVPYTKLKEVDRTKDREQVRRYPDFVKRAGYRIVFVK